MHRLMAGKVSVVLAVFLFILAINLSGGSGEPVTCFAFRLYIIPIALAAYWGGMKIACMMTSLVLLQGIVTTFMAGYEIPPNILFMIFSACIFLLTGKIVVGFKKRLVEIRKLYDGKYRKTKESYEGLFAEDKKLVGNNKKFEQKGTELAELYEISKVMGKSLDFEEILEITRESVHKTFEFSRGMLFLHRGKESNEFDFLYRLDSGEIEESVNTEKSEGFNYIIKEAKPLLISTDEVKNSFLGAPLILSDKVIGIAILENFSPRGTKERDEEEIKDIFSILTTQFALQMQKSTLYKEVERLSITDGLTGVALRRYFLQRFSEELKRAHHYNLQLSFIMIDIDHFKSYNDKYGHLVGDAILKDIARIIPTGIREVDLIGRYGGEEFCIMLPETDKTGGVETAERIRRIVEKNRFKAYDEETSVTISAGVSNFPEDANTEQELIDKADGALLAAKEEGRNRVCKC